MENDFLEMKYLYEKENYPIYSLSGSILTSKTKNTDTNILKLKDLKLEETNIKPTDGTEIFYNKEYNLFIRIPTTYFIFKMFGSKILSYSNLLKN